MKAPHERAELWKGRMGVVGVEDLALESILLS